MDVSAIPDRSGLLAFDWGRLFVHDVGPADDIRPPLLMLHDVLGCGFEFAPIVPQLAASRRILVVDLPGAGESDRPAPAMMSEYAVSRLAQCVDEALHALRVPSVHVMGLGFGALVGLALAADYPHTVGGVIAVAPPFFGVNLPYELGLARMGTVGEQVLMRAYRRGDLQRTLERACASPELLAPLLVDVLWDRLGREGGLAAARAMLLQIDRAGALLNRLALTRLKMLLLWGDRDVLVPPQQAQTICATLGWAELEVVEGCGHAVVQDRPEQVVKLVRGFCERSEAATPS